MVKITDKKSMVKEGITDLFVPEYANLSSDDYFTKLPVFFNPDMKINRDISLAMTHACDPEGKTYCDSFAASGVRSLRLSQELSLSTIYANDFDEKAVDCIEKNILLHNISNIIPLNKDANNLFLERKRYDFVDIDPFGSPARFLPNAPFALKKDAVLSVTATDAPVLCGVYPKKCLRYYATLSGKTEYCHEIAVRILLYTAARYLVLHDYAVEPLLAYAQLHHFRIYIKAKRSALRANESVELFGYISHCFSCGNRITQQQPISQCPLCKKKMKIIGPLWIGSLKENSYIEKAIDYLNNVGYNADKSIDLLFKVKNELDIPLFFDIHDMSHKVSCNAPPTEKVTTFLEKNNYIWSFCHYRPTGIKTDAPYEVILNFFENLEK